MVCEHGGTLIELWLLKYKPELLEEFREASGDWRRRLDSKWRRRTTASKQLCGAFSWRNTIWSTVYAEIVRWESINQIY